MVKNNINNELHSDGFFTDAHPSYLGTACRPRNKFGMTGCVDYGRSMVETLGVIALMGVLSIAGVQGYQAAMERHRANELINEASKRAIAVSSQVQMLGRAVPNDPDNSMLGEFRDPDGFTFKVGQNPNNSEQFQMQISGVSAEVCEQMQAMKAGAIHEVTCTTGESDTATLTFNKDLSANGTTSGNSNSGNDDTNDTPAGPCDAFPGTSLTGAGGFVPGYPCACEDEGDGWNGSACQTGYEEAEENDIGACATNADCAQYDACTGGVCFCNYKMNVDCQTGPTGQAGQCQVRKFGRLPSGATSEGYFRSKDYLDWYSAQNFCASYNNGQMATLSQMGLGNVVPSGKTWCANYTGSNACQNIDATGWSNIRAKFGNDWYPWTANLVPSDSCFAFNVYLRDSNANVDANVRSDYGLGGLSALCR